MKRISNEDGINAGARNVGRIALAGIPLALGLAASVWLGVWLQANAYVHMRAQEKRMAIYTAAEESPREHIQISVLKKGCARIQKVDLDGAAIVVYGKNECGHSVIDFEWYWQELSPNGTIIGQALSNLCPVPQPDETAECRMEIPNPDDRTKTVRVWIEVI